MQPLSFKEWGRSQGLRGQIPDTPEGRAKLAELEQGFNRYLAEATRPQATVFDDLPAPTVTSNPPVPATTSMPDEDFSSLVPQPSENALVGFADEQSRAAAPAAQPEREPLDYDGLLGVLSVRQLDLQGVPPKTDRDGWKRANNALMQRFVDSSDDLSKFGIVDMATFDVLAKEPYDVSRRAVENAKRAIEEGRAPDWDLAVKAAREQTSETGTAPEGKGLITTADVDKLTQTFGAENPIVLRAKAKLGNLVTEEYDMKALTTPGVVSSASNQAIRLANSDDVEAGGQLQGNLDTVFGAYGMKRKADDQSLGVARSILKERAGASDDLNALAGKMNEQEARLYKSELQRRGLTTATPEVIPIVTSGPDALTPEESWYRVREAARIGVPLLEMGVGEDGKRTIQSIDVSQNRAALNAYAKKFGGGGGDSAKSYGERQQEMLASLEATANDKSKSVLERAQAKTEMAKIQETAAKQGPKLQQEEEIRRRKELRQGMLKEFNELFDVTTAKKGVLSAPNRNPALDDETFEESLSRLEELAAGLGGMKDGYISRRMPDLQRLRKSLKKPSG